MSSERKQRPLDCPYCAEPYEAYPERLYVNENNGKSSGHCTGCDRPFLVVRDGNGRYATAPRTDRGPA